MFRYKGRVLPPVSYNESGKIQAYPSGRMPVMPHPAFELAAVLTTADPHVQLLILALVSFALLALFDGVSLLCQTAAKIPPYFYSVITDLCTWVSRAAAGTSKQESEGKIGSQVATQDQEQQHHVTRARTTKRRRVKRQ